MHLWVYPLGAYKQPYLIENLMIYSYNHLINSSSTEASMIKVFKIKYLILFIHHIMINYYVNSNIDKAEMCVTCLQLTL